MGATSGDHEAAGHLMQRMACQLELPKAQEEVANVDGAPWIRNQIEFHGLVDAIGLDFYHLRENLQKSRRIVFGEESAQGKTWLEGVMHTFRHVGYDSAWDQLVAWRSSARGSGLTPSRALLLQLLVAKTQGQASAFPLPSPPFLSRHPAPSSFALHPSRFPPATHLPPSRDSLFTRRW